MPRKVFISFLGFSNYGECIYTKDNYKSSSVRFIQEATLDYLCQTENWTEKDAAYILLTKGAEEKNWVCDGHKDFTTHETIKCEGLESRLKKMNLPFGVDVIRQLPDGNNETEIWEIFERVYQVLEDGDELYFDLTHGFRYLPMLVMVLINYSKFLKNTSVKSITYGNYDSRNRTTNEAPIIDLLPLSSLQDWTFAAGQFLDSGSVQRLAKLSNEKLKPVLREAKGKDEDATNMKKFMSSLENTVEDFQTCRGINIINSKNISLLRITAEKIRTTFIKPLNPVLEKIKNSFEAFSETPDVKNGFSAAKWCLDNEMYQQAVTILLENVVTFICMKQGLDERNKTERELINKAFNILEYNKPECEWKFSANLATNELLEQKQKIKELLNNQYIVRLSRAFATCTGIRNDFNHSGLVQNPSNPARIKEGIQKCINDIMKIIYE